MPPRPAAAPKPSDALRRRLSANPCYRQGKVLLDGKPLGCLTHQAGKVVCEIHLAGVSIEETAPSVPALLDKVGTALRRAEKAGTWHLPKPPVSPSS